MKNSTIWFVTLAKNFVWDFIINISQQRYHQIHNNPINRDIERKEKHGTKDSISIFEVIKCKLSQNDSEYFSNSEVSIAVAVQVKTKYYI